MSEIQTFVDEDIVVDENAAVPAEENAAVADENIPADTNPAATTTDRV